MNPFPYSFGMSLPTTYSKRIRNLPDTEVIHSSSLLHTRFSHITAGFGYTRSIKTSQELS